MEAAALSVPIITNDFAGAREMSEIASGFNLCPEDDPIQIAATCKRVIAEAPSASTRWLQLRETSNYWDIERYVRDFQRVFSEVLRSECFGRTLSLTVTLIVATYNDASISMRGCDRLLLASEFQRKSSWWTTVRTVGRWSTR